MREERAKYAGGSLIGMGFEVEAKAEEDGAGLRARIGEGGRCRDGVGGRWEGRAAAPVLGGRKCPAVAIGCCSSKSDT
jgi:hypothetical protein